MLNKKEILYQIKQLKSNIENYKNIDLLIEDYLNNIKPFEKFTTYVDNIRGYITPDQVNLTYLDNDEIAFIHNKNLSKFILDNNKDIDKIVINNKESKYFQFCNGVISNITKQDIKYYITIIVRDCECSI